MDKFKFTFVFGTSMAIFLFVRFMAEQDGMYANNWFYPVAITFALAFGFVASLKSSGNGGR